MHFDSPCDPRVRPLCLTVRHKAVPELEASPKAERALLCTIFINMAGPPSYEESTFYGQSFGNEKTDSKGLKRFSIREEVGASRSQHVAALVEKVLPEIRERAKSGLSKTTLLLLPSDQGEYLPPPSSYGCTR
jgi:hypothetical protein